MLLGLAESQRDPADLRGGAEFIPLEGDAGGHSLRELRAVIAGVAGGVREQRHGVVRPGEFEISGGAGEHRLASLRIELVLRGTCGLLGGETPVHGFAELEGDPEGGAGGDRFLGDVAHLADDILQLAGVLAVGDAGRERREERPGGAIGRGAGLAEAGRRELDVDRLGARQSQDGDQVDRRRRRGGDGGLRPEKTRRGEQEGEEAEGAAHRVSVTAWPSVSVAVPTTRTSSSGLRPSRISRFVPSLKPALSTRRRALPASWT